MKKELVFEYKSDIAKFKQLILDILATEHANDELLIAYCYTIRDFYQEKEKKFINSLYSSENSNDKLKRKLKIKLRDAEINAFFQLFDTYHFEEIAFIKELHKQLQPLYLDISVKRSNSINFYKNVIAEEMIAFRKLHEKIENGHSPDAGELYILQEKEKNKQLKNY